MSWNNGLAPDGSRLVLPRCGISYLDVVAAAAECWTIPATAVRLGVGETTLRHCIDEFSLGHWFQDRDAPRCPSKLTRRRLLYWLREVKEGRLTRKDVAAQLRCSYGHLNVMIRRHGLADDLPDRGRVSWIARRGAVIPASEGVRSRGRSAWADPIILDFKGVNGL